MLSDLERDALHKIRCPVLAEDSGFVQAFDTHGQRRHHTADLTARARDSARPIVDVPSTAGTSGSNGTSNGTEASHRRMK